MKLLLVGDSSGGFIASAALPFKIETKRFYLKLPVIEMISFSTELTRGLKGLTIRIAGEWSLVAALCCFY